MYIYIHIFDIITTFLTLLCQSDCAANRIVFILSVAGTHNLPSVISLCP